MAKIGKWRLGLDIGTNSVGWSVLALGEDGKEVQEHGIVAAGSRIFSDGRTDKTKTTLAATRRSKRGARRLRDRFLQRQGNLLNTLKEHGLFPTDKDEMRNLQGKNPLELRALALTEKLHPFEIGRALFHINQRRGFKSNRKDQSKEVKSGAVNQSNLQLLREMGAAGEGAKVDDIDDIIASIGDNPEESLGKFLWEQRYKKGGQTRARPRAGAEEQSDAQEGADAEKGAKKQGKMYDVYPTREMYLDEFHKIWNKQSSYHPGVMTEDLKKEVGHHIFFQRRLKPQERGRCQYMPRKLRTFRAMPSFQRYRIYQEVNNMSWDDEDVRVRDRVYVRDFIVHLLENGRGKTVTFKTMKKQLEKHCGVIDSIMFNYEHESSREDMDVNLTSRIMRHPDYVGEKWDKMSLWEQDKLVAVILGRLSDERALRKLQKEFGLSKQAARNCVYNASLPTGTASISWKAANLLLERMEKGITDEGVTYIPIQPEARDDASDTVDGFNPRHQHDLMRRLPYYGIAFQEGSHIIPGKKNPKDKGDDLKFYGGVSNITVHIALNQIRAVVNALIACYGRPYSIAIELGRDLPKGAEERNRVAKDQNAGLKVNRRLNENLESHGELKTRKNRLRLRLWEDQGGCCFYSGRNIGRAELFTEAEVDHIIPFSKSLDDTTANKVVCLRDVNRYKSDMTPWQAFHDNSDYNWGEIMHRARFKAKIKGKPGSKKAMADLKAKLWRFQKDPLKDRQKSGDFLGRHLNDTRYIGRMAREYLECICRGGRINVLTGQATAMLRWEWQLDSILPDEMDAKRKGKNRNDHRHHAIDAIVIGMTTRRLLVDVSEKARRGEEMRVEHLFPRNKDGTSSIEPWPNFPDDVKNIIDNVVASHRVNHKRKGQLHEETAYGIMHKMPEGGEGDASPMEVVLRRPIKDFTTKEDVRKIVDRGTREAFLKAFDEADATPGKKGADGIQRLAEKGIHRTRNMPVERPISAFTTRGDVAAIRNKGLREAFLKAFDADGAAGVQDLAHKKMIRNLPVAGGDFLRVPQKIRHLRVREEKTVLPIRRQAKSEPNGKLEVYKAYALRNNWATEVYELPSGEWEAVVISMFDACRKDFQPGMTKRPHRNAKLKMRLFIGDLIQLTDNGESHLVRVQMMSKGDLHMYHPNLANVAGRDEDAKSRRRNQRAQGRHYRLKGATDNLLGLRLRDLKAKKAHISPTGFVHVEDSDEE